MKKIILMATVFILGTVAAIAQVNESVEPVNPAPPVPIHSHGNEDKVKGYEKQKEKEYEKDDDKDKEKGYQKDEHNDKDKKNDHWIGAKHQLESAKSHLQKVSFDPGSQRENAIRYIDAALKEIDKAFSVPAPVIVNPPTK